MSDKLKYHDGELKDIEEIPADVKARYRTAFAIDYHWLIQAAARRQKWIDQSQSVNLFLAKPDMKTLSHMYRDAWRAGLKTTYYLRTLQASNIEKATTEVQKEIRGITGLSSAEGAAAAAAAGSAIESAAATKREFSEVEKSACSIEAMMNGETCEACQ